jgi:phage repressor protein C with HTH and peptisase S24 domain
LIQVLDRSFRIESISFILMQVFLSEMTNRRKVSFLSMNVIDTSTKAARIKFVRKLAGMTQEAFATALGNSRGAVGNWELGKGIKTENLTLISDRFGVSAEWLIREHGSRPTQTILHAHAGDGHIDSDDVLDGNSRPLHAGISTVQPYEPELPNASPVVSSALSAGGGRTAQSVVTARGGITYSANAVLGEISLPPAVSSSLSPAPTNRIHWFEVRGDSMEPTLAGGDWVGVNTTDLAIGQGGVFALLDGNGEILVKRLRRLRGADSTKVEIISDNPRQGKDTESLEAITVFGRIVARISRVG